MRLVGKLTLAFVVALALVMVLHASLRIERERRLIESDMAREQGRIGALLAALLPRLAAADGAPSVEALLRDLEGRAGGLRLRLGSDAPVAATASGVERRDGERHLVTRIALPTGSAPPMAIELAESLSGEDAYVRDTLRAEIATGVVLAATCSLIAAGLGAWLVGRPTRRLLAHADRIGGGDLSPGADPGAHDELGDLERAMNGMAARLAAMQRSLAAETARRLAALEQMRHADRLATVGTLASGIAHELGTPLNVVAEYGRMIARAELPGPEITAAGRIVLEQSERMTAIIRQLLDFARRRPGRREHVDMAELAARTGGLLAPMARKRGVVIAIAPCPTPAACEADPAQIQQVLANLIVNAVHASPAGASVAVRLETRGTPPDRLAVLVEDAGPGIPAADLPRVFEPFFTTKPLGQGTGLGLSVAHGIATEHGGTIEIDSAPGRGTRAVVVLPLSGAPAAAPSARPPQPEQCSTHTSPTIGGTP